MDFSDIIKNVKFDDKGLVPCIARTEDLVKF